MTTTNNKDLTPVTARRAGVPRVRIGWDVYARPVEPIEVDLSQNTLFIGGSGKSSFLRSIATRAVVSGAQVDVIDPKWTEFLPLSTLPGVTLHVGRRGAGDVVRDFYTSIKDRQEALESGLDVYDRARFPARYLVIDDHLNALMHTCRKCGESTVSDMTMSLLSGPMVGHYVVAASSRAGDWTIHSLQDAFGNVIAAGPVSRRDWKVYFPRESRILRPRHRGDVAARLHDGPEHVTHVGVAGWDGRDLIGGAA